jgi:ABC-type lipoprotein release transport system permease subunit
MMGRILAENLEVKVGDTLVLLGQGYHGVTAVGKYRIGALLNFPIDDLSKSMIYMDLANCQDLFSLQNRITNEVLMVNNPEEVGMAKKNLESKIKGDLKLYSWDELQPELVSLIDGKLASGKFIKTLLFIIIGFGVWSTIIMLMAERKREFGVMMALGMKKLKLAALLVIESFFIALLGILSGILLTFPLVFYFYINPIRLSGEIAKTYSKLGFEPVLDFGIKPEVFLGPSTTIFIIFIFIIFYEIWFLFKLKTTSALKA